MARLYSHRHGKSHSNRPILITKPSWVQLDASQVEELVVKLAKEGMKKSLIGITLRDQYGVPSVKAVTGKRIGQILKEKKVTAYDMEDLKDLIRQADEMKKHLERYKADRLARHSLQLLESKIRRLVRYYKDNGLLPPDWKYESR
ncbi:MAG: 30S ribosomal protein S15 [Thermoproteota archaeon]